MLDPVACTGMELGTRRVSLAALAELHELLVAQGFRASSRDDRPVIEEMPDDARVDTTASTDRTSPDNLRFATVAPLRKPGRIPLRAGCPASLSSGAQTPRTVPVNSPTVVGPPPESLSTLFRNQCPGFAQNRCPLCAGIRSYFQPPSFFARRRASRRPIVTSGPSGPNFAPAIDSNNIAAALDGILPWLTSPLSVKRFRHTPSTPSVRDSRLFLFPDLHDGFNDEAGPIDVTSVALVATLRADVIKINDPEPVDCVGDKSNGQK